MRWLRWRKLLMKIWDFLKKSQIWLQLRKYWGSGRKSGNHRSTAKPATPDPILWGEDPLLDPEREYQALLRSLRRKREFGLIFVQCSTARGTQLFQQIKQELPQKKIDQLQFDAPIPDGNFLRCVEQYVASHPPVDILFVQGLHLSLLSYEQEKKASGSLTPEETLTYSEKDLPRLLINLNLGRERLREEFPLCFVFVLPLFAIKYLTRRAPDFFDWRSGVFELPTDAELVEQESRRLWRAGDYNQYCNWTQDDRDRRHKELQIYIDEPHQTPDRKANLLLEQGLLFAAAKRYELAIFSYDRALQYKPDFPEAWNNRAIALSDLSHAEAALASYDQALYYKPDDPETWYNRGNTLGKLGRQEEAIVSYEQALRYNPNNPEVHYNCGNMLYSLGRVQEAIASYDLALHHESDFPDAWHNRGIALDNLGLTKEAIASYDQALRYKPDDPDAWSNRGIALGNLGCYEEAIASYNQALRYKPDHHHALDKLGDSDAWYNRGIALGNLGRYGEAINVYNQVLRYKSDHYQAWINRGIALVNLGHYKEAISNYDHVLALKPDDHQAWYNRGNALYDLGRYEEAIVSYNQALGYKLDYADAIYHKACCLYWQGNVTKALSYLRQAILLDSHYRKLAATDPDLADLRDHPKFQALVNDHRD
jgi:tetratricopeptide (TPR) repeat protein